MGMCADLERQGKAWGKVSVNVEERDTVESIVRKLKAEGKRHGALELSQSDLRGMAKDMLREARTA